MTTAGKQRDSRRQGFAEGVRDGLRGVRPGPVPVAPPATRGREAPDSPTSFVAALAAIEGEPRRGRGDPSFLLGAVVSGVVVCNLRGPLLPHFDVVPLGLVVVLLGRAPLLPRWKVPVAWAALLVLGVGSALGHPAGLAVGTVSFAAVKVYNAAHRTHRARWLLWYAGLGACAWLPSLVGGARTFVSGRPLGGATLPTGSLVLDILSLLVPLVPVVLIQPALDRYKHKQAVSRAVQDERDQIARELHDVVAHHLTVISLQARGARGVLEIDPERAAEALGVVDRATSDALVEFRRMLGVLRRRGGDGGEDGDGSRAPQPGVGSLERLADEVRRAGVPVELRVEGDTSLVPGGVGVAIHRITQEALTNTLKHAGPGARAVAELRCGVDAAEVDISDDGHPDATLPPGTGGGLRGMCERVSVFGGTIAVGPRPEGGWLVRARVPYSLPR